MQALSQLSYGPTQQSSLQKLRGFPHKTRHLQHSVLGISVVSCRARCRMLHHSVTTEKQRWPGATSRDGCSVTPERARDDSKSDARRLTARAIEALKPKPHLYEVTDPAYAGLLAAGIADRSQDVVFPRAAAEVRLSENAEGGCERDVEEAAEADITTVDVPPLRQRYQGP